MKVAVVYHAFPLYRKGVIKELAAADERFVFVGDTEERAGIKNYRFDQGGELVRVRNWHFGRLLFQLGVVKLAIFGRYDSFVFLANPNHISTWISAAICRLRGIRVIFWGHGFLSPPKGMKRRIRVAFFSLANAFYTYGYRAKVFAESCGFDPSAIHVGFNSLDYREQLRQRDQLLDRAVSGKRTNRDVLEIVCISRLTAICRYELLIEASCLLRERYGIRAVVTFIGDGPELEHLRELAREKALAVEFLGAIYSEEKIAPIIFNADVTVSPGKIGLTAMHSLMYGTPVISHSNLDTQMPEVEAVVPGKTGFLFDPGSVQGLTEALRQIHALAADRELLRRNCFRMIDEIYNPMNQARVLTRAVRGESAERGDTAWRLFEHD